MASAMDSSLYAYDNGVEESVPHTSQYEEDEAEYFEHLESLDEYQKFVQAQRQW